MRFSMCRSVAVLRAASWFVAICIWAVSNIVRVAAAQDQYPGYTSVTIDTLLPQSPTLIAPADDATVNTYSPQFIWSEPDDPGGSGIKNYRIYIDDEPAFATPRIKAYTTTNTTYSPALYEGSFYWKVYARDNAGNQSEWSETWNLEIDTTPPRIIYTDPPPGGVTPWYASDPGESIDIDFSAGSGSPLAYARYRISSHGTWRTIFTADSLFEYTPDWRVDWEEIDDCSAYVSIEVADAAGNITQHICVAGSSGCIVLKDVSPPEITCPPAVNARCDNGQCTASGINLGRATATDPCGTIPRIDSDAPTNFLQGTTHVTWTATDTVGHCAACTQRVVIDDIEKPSILLTPMDRFCWNTPPCIAHVCFHDNCGLDSSWFRIDSGPWHVFSSDMTGPSCEVSTWYIPDSLFASLLDGPHVLGLKATDSHGNDEMTSDKDDWTFVKDTTPPSPPEGLSSTSHTPGVWSTATDIHIVWDDPSGTDGRCGILRYSILWDSDPAAIPSPDSTGLFIAAAVGSADHVFDEGIYYIHMRGVDEAGNWQAISQVCHYGPFCIDVTKPICSIFSCPSDTPDVCDEITIHFSGEDVFCPTEHLEFSYMLVGVDQKPSEWAAIQSVSYILPEGSHTFWAWTRDQAGNISASAECAIFTSTDYCTKGDVNADCRINILDVARCASLILDPPSNLPAAEQCRADCREDGRIDILDALWIANYILERGN